MALHALATFARLTYGSPVGLEVHAEGVDLDASFTVNGANSLLLQTHPIQLPNRLSFRITGTGCVLVQVDSSYDVYSLLSKTKEPYAK